MSTRLGQLATDAGEIDHARRRARSGAGRRADRPGARGSAAAGARADQPRDRARARGPRGDDQVPRQEHPAKAGRDQPSRRGVALRARRRDVCGMSATDASPESVLGSARRAAAPALRGRDGAGARAARAPAVRVGRRRRRRRLRSGGAADLDRRATRAAGGSRAGPRRRDRGAGGGAGAAAPPVRGPVRCARAGHGRDRRAARGHLAARDAVAGAGGTVRGVGVRARDPQPGQGREDGRRGRAFRRPGPRRCDDARAAPGEPAAARAHADRDRAAAPAPGHDSGRRAGPPSRRPPHRAADAVAVVRGRAAASSAPRWRA